jgi:glutamate synthase (NADPH) GltB2 subunit (EC 1.4.1.13)
LIIKAYLPLPKQTDSEFWTIDKIEHIRHLATTGKPYKILDKEGIVYGY